MSYLKNIIDYNKMVKEYMPINLNEIDSEFHNCFDYQIYPELVTVAYEKPLSIYEVKQETIRKKTVNMWFEVRNQCVCIHALEQMKFGNINDCTNEAEEHWCKNCKICKCYH